MNYFNNIINIYFIFIWIILIISLIFIFFLNLNKQIEILKNDLNELIKKYKIFNDKIIEAKKHGISKDKYNNHKLIEIIELVKNEIQKLDGSQNTEEDRINSNKDIIIKKQEDEIDKLKEKLSEYSFELSKGEHLISVIFTSSDENMYYSIICKNTDKFIELEQKLYKDYPEYSTSDNYFMINGNRVNKAKSLDENKIRNSDIIILTQNNI